MNDPPVMLALLVAFVLGFALAGVCVLICGKRQASACEEELRGHLARQDTELDQARRELQQNYELQRMATAARPRSHS